MIWIKDLWTAWLFFRIIRRFRAGNNDIQSITVEIKPPDDRGHSSTS